MVQLHIIVTTENLDPMCNGCLVAEVGGGEGEGRRAEARESIEIILKIRWRLRFSGKPVSIRGFPLFGFPLFGDFLCSGHWMFNYIVIIIQSNFNGSNTIKMISRQG